MKNNLIICGKNNINTKKRNSGLEYKNCMGCSALATCKNRLKGHVYMPANIEGNLQFQYRSCKYYDKYKLNIRYLKKVTYFNTPASLKEATLSKIHKNDKNRYFFTKKRAKLVKNY